ncbi:MAG: bifunctional folylpolyglutamate synthase/dihydrofolate synthase [Flavobacteriales bacterium]|nr:bifunctional folylpolyglutamate synthase/dihydrofolate synthase [Flavobacteriales bacterium]
MNYEETISYLFDQLPIFQRQGAAAYRKDLRNTLALARMTDNPENGFKSIHLAGTNGKGSTAHGLASVFQACGYKTGLLTSPHYKDFRERIKVNGKMVSKEFVTQWVERYRNRFEEIKPSFFELSVIMGFCYFKEQEVDIAIIETGMGGRLDSTNIIDPELSVITTMSLDHKAFLGDTLEKIAFEKAGIIKQDKPVVIAYGNEEVLEVFKSVAKSRNSPVLLADKTDTKISTDLAADYQQVNMSTVLKAADVMRALGWKLPEEEVALGLMSIQKNTGFLGRWQTISKRPKIIADVGHNPQGIETVIRQLQNERYKHLHIVLGMVADKDVDAVLSILPLSANYYFCQAKVLRAMSCDLLAQQGMRMGLIGECYGSVTAALTAAKEAASENDLILITGSVFVVAEVV